MRNSTHGFFFIRQIKLVEIDTFLS